MFAELLHIFFNKSHTYHRLKSCATDLLAAQGGGRATIIDTCATVCSIYSVYVIPSVVVNYVKEIKSHMSSTACTSQIFIC